MAALAFDVGMMLLERRDEQNAADAAALAGARYIFEPDCVAPAWTCTEARAAAVSVALDNGYDDADPIESVFVHIPAQQGRYAGLPNFIEVQLNSERPSIFGGVIGQEAWPVSVFAVATNDHEVDMEVSMLALNPTACKAIKVAGQGEVVAYGNIQSNSNGSDCPEDEGGDWGMSRSGGGELTIVADDATCKSAGDIQDSGSGTMTCTQAPNSGAAPDPFVGLDPPARPGLAAAMQPVGHALPVSPYCPGSLATPPTETVLQQTCDPGDRAPGQRRGDYTGKAWILSPGLYPNGISATNNVILYMLPGVYWIAGGGFQVAGGSTVISIKDVADAHVNPSLATWSGDDCELNPTTTTTEACGVLIYNSRDTSVPFASGPVSLGGNGGVLLLTWLDVPTSDPYADYETMVIFQDRFVTETVTLNGSSADAEVAGIIYVPSGHVQVNGGASDLVLDQIIADTFTINGNTGTITVMMRVSISILFAAAGLVD